MQQTDLSYGVYLYAWPVQQLLLFRWEGMALGAHITASLAGAAAFATFSWRFVEAPALRLKGPSGRRGTDGDAGGGDTRGRTPPSRTVRVAGKVGWGAMSIGVAEAVGCALGMVIVSCCVAHVPVWGLDLC